MDNEIFYDHVFLSNDEDELLLIYNDEGNFDEEYFLIYDEVWKNDEEVTPEDDLADVEHYAVLMEVMDTPTMHVVWESEEEMAPEENLDEVVDRDSMEEMEEIVTSTINVADLLEEPLLFDPEELTVNVPEDIAYSGFFAGQGDDLKSCDASYKVIASETLSHSPGEVTEVTDFIRYLNQDFVFQAYSPPSIPSLHTDHCPHHGKSSPDVFWSDMEEVSCILLRSAAAYMDPPAHVNDATVSFVARGLSLAKGFTTEEGISPSGQQGIGRLVAAIVMDRQSCIVMAYAVIHLVPQTMTDDNTGELMGMVLHNVIRGFAINDHFRHIIIENSRSFLLAANQIPT
ncbi:uncharacterized protein LOC6553121 [Drosophila erecta]|uniref:GG13490 n=1 Tax=Drosophila erecta TaxID=7220 RepID=B3P2M1_DROER|nr:uncharacterized protein LOC6553121 [Drosophila erecta]EDV48043.1 uncharacterized protein Dere_GG13490 [Drosophila erecta]